MRCGKLKVRRGRGHLWATETDRHDKVGLDDAQQDTGQDGEEEDDENAVLERGERVVDVQELEWQTFSFWE